LEMRPSSPEVANVAQATAPLANASLAPAAPPAPPASETETDPFPARTYGKLDAKSCLRELDDRMIPYERYGHARGVSTPVRLIGPLHGILYIHNDSNDWLASAKREVLDCRLLLSLDDLSRMLATHGVATVVHYGIYRGDVPLPAKGRPQHHVAGMAIDVAAFVKGDGTRVEVLRDFSRRAGVRSCRDAEAAPGLTNGALELRGIVCDLAKDRMFHQVLTPNHDARHRDHFHLEVMRDTSWTLIQ
jgi:hypothetical protein